MDASPLLDQYKNDETNPVNETIERAIMKDEEQEIEKIQYKD